MGGPQGRGGAFGGHRAALAWVAKHSVRAKDLTQSDTLRPALAAISVKLNGKPAADNTVNRKRTVLSNALRYAVERGLLDVNPLSRIDWSPPPTIDEVDFRYVPGPNSPGSSWKPYAPKGRAENAFTRSSVVSTTRPCGRQKWQISLSGTAVCRRRGVSSSSRAADRRSARAGWTTGSRTRSAG